MNYYGLMVIFWISNKEVKKFTLAAKRPDEFEERIEWSDAMADSVRELLDKKLSKTELDLVKEIRVFHLNFPSAVIWKDNGRCLGA